MHGEEWLSKRTILNHLNNTTFLINNLPLIETKEDKIIDLEVTTEEEEISEIITTIDIKEIEMISIEEIIINKQTIIDHKEGQWIEVQAEEETKKIIEMIEMTETKDMIELTETKEMIEVLETKEMKEVTEDHQWDKEITISIEDLTIEAINKTQGLDNLTIEIEDQLNSWKSTKLAQDKKTSLSLRK